MPIRLKGIIERCNFAHIMPMQSHNLLDLINNKYMAIHSQLFF